MVAVDADPLAEVALDNASDALVVAVDAEPDAEVAEVDELLA